MYLRAIILSFLSARIILIGGRFIGFRGAGFLRSASLLITWWLTLLICYEVGLRGVSCRLRLGNWIVCGLFDVSWTLMFDRLTRLMLVVIRRIRTVVHLYALGYMADDPHLTRFLGYLSFFTLCMFVLVTAENLLQLFVGWEGVGVASYLLINFWSTRLSANKSAIKAMVMNRIGDLGLVVGIGLLFNLVSALDVPTLSITAPELYDYVLVVGSSTYSCFSIVGVCLLIGATGKSRQLGLHTWLPDAMEGPTPVSALIHAATMVTAGIFLIIRFSLILQFVPRVSLTIRILGRLTAFYGARIGFVQNDIKRVIAYSTCSQLGYMVFACGLSAYSTGLVHLLNHAFFKALLFLSAGCLIHSLIKNDEQDIRKMGGLLRLLPLTYLFLSLGSIALIGWPFLTGFYSKDLILEIAEVNYTIHGELTTVLGLFSAGLTAFYSMRLLSLTFFARSRGSIPVYAYVLEATHWIAYPLGILLIGAVSLGWYGREIFLRAGTDFWGIALVQMPDRQIWWDGDLLPLSFKLVPFVRTCGGIFLARVIIPSILDYSLILKVKSCRKIFYLLNRRWGFDSWYNRIIGLSSFLFGYTVSLRHLDKGRFEVFGPERSLTQVPLITSKFKQIQRGSIFHWATFILSGIFGLGFIFFFNAYWYNYDLRVIMCRIFGWLLFI